MQSDEINYSQTVLEFEKDKLKARDVSKEKQRLMEMQQISQVFSAYATKSQKPRTLIELIKSKYDEIENLPPKCIYEKIFKEEDSLCTAKNERVDFDECNNCPYFEPADPDGLQITYPPEPVEEPPAELPDLEVLDLIGDDTTDNQTK